MKSIILHLFIAMWLSQLSWASPVVIDLSRSHSFEDLKRSGLALKEIAGGKGERDFVFENQKVKILLPGGRSIQQQVELGIVDTKDGLLTRLSMTGGVMPQEQAYQVAKSFLQNFNLPKANLEEWNTQNQGRQFGRNSFGASSGWGFYPRVGLAISSSVNKLYPWVVRCEMEWGRREQRDWNEERVWRELPPPKAAAISLDPPSGQTYDRREAYKESLEEQARFEKELAAKGQASTPTMTPNASAPTTTPKPTPVVQAESSKSFPWPWIIGAILLLTMTGAIFIKLRRE
jgi:hypothetical protein